MQTCRATAHANAVKTPVANVRIAQVEVAEAEVLAACAALSVRSFSASAQRWRADQLAQHLTQNDNALFAAFRGDDVVAFALFTQQAGEGELASICSDPVMRRQGHARLLMVHALNALQPQQLILEVAADNLAAISLYEGLGFREIARRNAYYSAENGPATDALVMALSHAK